MENKPSSIQAAQRGIWFFMRTIALVAALVFLAYGVFITAMRSTNLYILATEGLTLRAECILKGEISSELREYFTEKFIEDDKQLYGSTYENYTITSFDYRIEVEKISVLPWSDVATVTLVDRMVALNGSLNEDKRPANAPEGTDYPPPEWNDRRYHLRFQQKNNRFYIYQLQLIEDAPEQALQRTPNMNMTPIPAYEEES